MLKAIEHSLRGAWPEAEAVDRLTLDFDSRHRRCVRLTTDGGEEVLLDLLKAVTMAHGDGLMLEDGRWLRVAPAPEALLEVRSQDATRLRRYSR
jgi:urease accessory protein